METKLKKIFIVSGKARHGKDTTCSFIKDVCEKRNLKVINLSFGSYIKEYVKKITGWDGSEETKEQVRTTLQQVGTEVVRDNIDEDFFVKRLIDDIKVYSYFFDIITVSDARLVNEIEIPKKVFENVISINVVRTNFESNLSLTEQKHRTEIGLDSYDKYDYKIINDSSLDELKQKIENLIEGEIK